MSPQRHEGAKEIQKDKAFVAIRFLNLMTLPYRILCSTLFLDSHLAFVTAQIV